MKLSSNFNRWYWKNIIADIKERLDYPIVVGEYKINLHQLKRESVHELLKMLTSFPKKEDGTPRSLTEITPLHLVLHLEEVRVIMSQNSFTFSVDEEEWNRTIKSIK